MGDDRAHRRRRRRGRREGEWFVCRFVLLLQCHGKWQLGFSQASNDATLTAEKTTKKNKKE